MVIGLFLPPCIVAIVRNEIEISAVEKIIIGTRADTQEKFLRLLKEYQATCWRKFPERAMEIALGLYHAGKIEQPRLTHPPRFPVVGRNVIWVNSEDEIRWAADSFAESQCA